MIAASIKIIGEDQDDSLYKNYRRGFDDSGLYKDYLRGFGIASLNIIIGMLDGQSDE
jgi:hypothetical protein